MNETMTALQRQRTVELYCNRIKVAFPQLIGVKVEFGTANRSFYHHRPKSGSFRKGTANATQTAGRMERSHDGQPPMGVRQDRTSRRRRS